MTAVLTNVGAGRPWRSSFAEVVTGWMVNTNERQRFRREKRALSQLPYRLLRDLGLEQYAKPANPIIRHHFCSREYRSPTPTA
ncbi:hypothetical protein ACFMPD_02755 [Sedimentitalea sp. HM32M-2]|uniref:hypothetical protein n=1 Tax=Sedimentitalea sp. HM32M-2 TaxID=3351566 RepID=UPI0036263F33